MVKVEVGCGPSPNQGYIHCDIKYGDDVEYVCCAWEIPFDDDSVDEIYSRHMLEHLTIKEFKDTLAKWLRVLKSGGYVDINVPDIEQHMIQFYKDGNSPISPYITNREHALAGFYGWQRDEHDVHKWGYTFNTLSELLTTTGFVDVERVFDPSYLNLRVKAYK